MYLLNAINSDRQTRLLNVFGQNAMILGDKKKFRSQPLKTKIKMHYVQNLSSYSRESMVCFHQEVQFVNAVEGDKIAKVVLPDAVHRFY